MCHCKGSEIERKRLEIGREANEMTDRQKSEAQQKR